LFSGAGRKIDDPDDGRESSDSRQKVYEQVANRREFLRLRIFDPSDFLTSVYRRDASIVPPPDGIMGRDEMGGARQARARHVRGRGRIHLA
jgi:hypothetical protein